MNALICLLSFALERIQEIDLSTVCAVDVQFVMLTE